ncbi:hypothetical protein [Chryseobacterium aureum]|uniref:hypothetical protein n=1 Tax=Chryseobacterium aureum TaxID=2497456 RepID=UPI000F873DB4|nr:hypothetical protein [Chryseobacterium aureum]
MPIVTKIKNKTHWALTIMLGLGLLMLFFIILIIIPLTSFQEQGFYAVIHFILSVAPFAAFFILFLYFWLWNTFGKTVLMIEPEQITVRYKNKLFTKPKIYLKSEIEQILVKDFKIERHQLGVRYHFSISGSTYSVVLVQKGNESRIVNWITENKACEIADEIKKMGYNV